MRRSAMLLILMVVTTCTSPLLAQAPGTKPGKAAPDRAALMILEVQDPVGIQYTAARLNDVIVVFCAKSGGERAVEAVPDGNEGADEHEVIDQAPSIEFQGGIFDTFAFGSGPGSKTIESAAEALKIVLRKEIERVHEAAPLAEEQRRKLELAGRGDIKRFLDRMTRLKARLEQTESILTASQFRDWVGPLAEEAETIGRMLDTGIFETDSLFDKTRQAIEPRGSQAPDIPQEGWINGAAPDYNGQPYLIHYWGTFVGSSRQDLQTLKQLAAEGACIMGIHPSSVAAEKIAGVIQDEGLPYPTLAATHRALPSYLNIDGCRVKSVPYCIVVDRNGFVAAHGKLSSALLAKFQELRAQADRDALSK